MEDGGLVISWGMVFSVLGFLGTIATNIGIIAVWGGSINARLKQVESHGEKVDQIAPLKASFEALQATVGVEFKNMREDMRELAQSVRELAKARVA